MPSACVLGSAGALCSTVLTVALRPIQAASSSAPGLADHVAGTPYLLGPESSSDDEAILPAVPATTAPGPSIPAASTGVIDRQGGAILSERLTAVRQFQQMRKQRAAHRISIAPLELSTAVSVL